MSIASEHNSHLPIAWSIVPDLLVQDLLIPWRVKLDVFVSILLDTSMLNHSPFFRCKQATLVARRFMTLEHPLHSSSPHINGFRDKYICNGQNGH